MGVTGMSKNATNTTTNGNEIGLDGIDFVEFCSPKPELLHRLFLDFGFSRIARHREKKIDLYEQNDIHFLVNSEPNSFADGFRAMHGPSVCSMGWRVTDSQRALSVAFSRGARLYQKGDFSKGAHRSIPAIYGIGESLIYFIDDYNNPNRYQDLGFKMLSNPDLVPARGFQTIDHLTNNVEKGTMKHWADFYKNIFGFTEIRYFDIRGVKTGLTSFALRSPCGKFCIPINEADEEKSQINEYLREYSGPGIQHIALLTNDIVTTLESLRGTSVQTLDVDDDYYDTVFDRVPNVTEDRNKLKNNHILVDGDDEGYLLQIFTHNLIGPIFMEIIQRKNHFNFGEGNFQALFKTIEREQMKRGVFQTGKNPPLTR